MEQFDAAISLLRERLRSQEEKALATKKLINDLCREAGKDLPFADAELMSSSGLVSIQADTFYGQPLNSSARKVLEMRKASGAGPATVKDIHAAMVQGGFQFKAKNDRYAIDMLRAALSKASHTFHKLPNGQYGLLDWYPAVKAKKQKGSLDADQSPETDLGDAPEGGDS